MHVVKMWQDHISKHYYICTLDILKVLSKSYASDERIKEDIDQYGEGISDFMARAIDFYVATSKNDD